MNAPHKLPRLGTKTSKVLMFIGTRDGARYGDIVRFICEMNGKNYDLMEPSYARRHTSKRPLVRSHRGEWGTNLTARKTGVFARFCMKGPDRRWYLREDVAKTMADVTRTGYWTSPRDIHFLGGFFRIAEGIISRRQSAFAQPSLLDGNFPSDEIVGNSKIIDRVIITPAEYELPKETELEALIRQRREIRKRIDEANRITDEAREAARKAAAYAEATSGEVLKVYRELDEVGRQILKLIDEPTK